MSSSRLDETTAAEPKWMSMIQTILIFELAVEDFLREEPEGHFGRSFPPMTGL